MTQAFESEQEILPPEETGEENISETGESAAEAAQKEAAELKDRLLRAMAEAENIRKRGERDREETAKYAVTALARDLINVAENLKRALDSATPEARANNELVAALAAGVDMTLGELLGVFERHGIRRIDPIGQKFDHNFHQAVAQIDAPDAEPGSVVQVLQAGYVLNNRLLRPAMVGVAKAGPREAAPQVDTTA